MSSDSATQTSTKKTPELTLGDEMIKRAAYVIQEAPPEADSAVVARAVLEAAFKDVPIANYSIGTLLQFFDHVICLKAGTAGGVYEATGPESFDELPHSLNMTYRKNGQLASIQITGLNA